MERIEIYDKVNACETLEELALVIESLGDEKGFIQGRTRRFSSKLMAVACREYHRVLKNTLTREFGIRQQAMYILYYTEGKV